MEGGVVWFLPGAKRNLAALVRGLLGSRWAEWSSPYPGTPGPELPGLKWGDLGQTGLTQLFLPVFLAHP